MPVIVSLFAFLLLLAAAAHARADAADPCQTEVAFAMLGRAMEARDDFFFWDEIDEREASADLERFVSRLEKLQQFVTDCAPREPGIAALQWQVGNALKHASDVASARRAAANREARSR